MEDTERGFAHCRALAQCSRGHAALFASRCVPGDTVMEAFFRCLTRGFVCGASLKEGQPCEPKQQMVVWNLARSPVYCRLALHVSLELKSLIKQLRTFTEHPLLYVNQGTFYCGNELYVRACDRGPLQSMVTRLSVCHAHMDDRTRLVLYMRYKAYAIYSRAWIEYRITTAGKSSTLCSLHTYDETAVTERGAQFMAYNGGQFHVTGFSALMETRTLKPGQTLYCVRRRVGDNEHTIRGQDGVVLDSLKQKLQDVDVLTQWKRRADCMEKLARKLLAVLDTCAGCKKEA